MISSHTVSMPAPGRSLTRVAVLGLALLLGIGNAAHAATNSGNPWETDPYALGRGLYFPEQGLRIGGYTDLQYYNLQGQSSTLRVRDLSLFLTKDLGSRWKLFTEIEAGDALYVSSTPAEDREQEVDVERLYVDYRASPAATVRLGKFLTPVGQWNLVHADPLTWTVSRPLTTSAAFARHAAGLMLYGTQSVAGRDMDYWVFADNTQHLDVGQDQDEAFSSYGADGTVHNNFTHALGGRVLYHLIDDRLGVGISWLAYGLQIPRQEFRLVGLDFSWSGRLASFTGEAVVRSSDGVQTPAERGGFLEAQIPIAAHLFGVARYERYRADTPLLAEQTLQSTQTLNLRTLGLNYQPTQGLVLKLEHRSDTNARQIAPGGWLVSVAVLF